MIGTILQTTVSVLTQGGTLLYPTDTIWGVGCDARNAATIEKLYTIKRRDRSKSMLLLCSEEMLDCQWPTAPNGRPTTYILPEARWRAVLRCQIANNLVAEDGSIGIRVPRHDFCQQMLSRLGAPVVSTSANMSGMPSPSCYADIDDELKKRIDYCVPPLQQWLSTERNGSRIVKLNDDGSEQIIRP